ncbi:MAG: ABC transporter permease [Cyclobacteriaceae bacterium]
MLRHSLLLIYRNFQRFKSTFFINLIGLSSGLACALLIYLWVHDELSTDAFHEHGDRLYRVMAQHAEANEITTMPYTTGLLGEALEQEMPEVAYVASTSGVEDFTLTVGEQHIGAAGQFVSKDFFKVFSYELVQGDPEQVLADKSSVVISEEMAMTLFNTTEDVVGKTLEWQAYVFTKDVIVTGVFKDVPKQTSEPFEFLLSFDYFQDDLIENANWGNYYAMTDVLLQAGADAEQLDDKLAGFMQSKQEDSNITLFLKPYSERYLYGDYTNGVLTGGRIAYVRLFSIIAIFILVIACINFMNLSTAKASRRIKEVGIKKAIGARRTTLIAQYLGESIMMATLSLLTAIILVSLLLPQFNQITGKLLTLTLDIPLLASVLGITLLTGLLAGSYPALYLSGFDPTTVLKGRFNSSVGELWARKGLVVFQFALSVILIVAVWVVYQQIAFVQAKNLGYDRDNIIHFPAEGKVLESMETFLSEMQQLPGVVSASSMRQNLVGASGFTTGVNWPGKDPDAVIRFQNITVNYGLIEMLGMEMATGRSFSQDFISDTSAIIFNEAAMKVMGLEDPIGQTVNLWGQDRLVVGVVKDFHYKSLHEQVAPLFLKLAEGDATTMMAKIEAGRMQETIEQLQSFYQAYNPGYTFNYQFLDEDYQALYAAEQRVSTLSKYFAGLAILISCLGLFGLAAFTAERRLKEIGIRKILGASNAGIVYLLSGDFTKMVLIAIAIALPISYFAAQAWLQRFAFSIDLKVWYFAGAGLVALLIAWFSVGFQTIKAARVNPAQCLKDE